MGDDPHSTDLDPGFLGHIRRRRYETFNLPQEITLPLPEPPPSDEQELGREDNQRRGVVIIGGGE